MIILYFIDNLLLIIPWIAALVIAITIHEFAHGFSAFKLGDNTAERAGRLTLNPLAHLDVIGSLMLFIVGFGWAKPVPISPHAIERGKLGQFIVSSAGILTNLFFAIMSVIALKFLFSLGFNQFNLLIRFLAFLSYINLSLFIFNLIPIAPLDGYRLLESIAPRIFYKIAPVLEQWGYMVLLFLVFFTNIIGYIISFSVNLASLVSGINIYYLAFFGLK